MKTSKQRLKYDWAKSVKNKSIPCKKSMMFTELEIIETEHVLNKSTFFD